VTRTALLSMDYQLNHLAQVPADHLDRVARTLAAARAADVPVIHIVVQLRPGHVDAHPHNKIFGNLPHDRFTADDPGSAIHPDLAPRDGELVVTKNRVNAFAGNNLQQLLAVRGIDHLVLAGIATSGVVLSTVVQATDLDYRVTVLSDGCADGNPALHETLMNDVFARRGEVTTTADWARSLAATS
jgi:nicotinamidase-related amidase